MRLLITPYAAATLFHGIAARTLLVRPVHRFHFLLRRALRVRTTRFRQGGSEGICPRESIGCEVRRSNRETKEEPLINELRSGFLLAREREILLHSRSAKLAEPDVPRENWYPA